MEGKLLEAARTGDVAALKDLVREQAEILQKLHSCGATNTPLHLASMFGHVDFVREYTMLSSISTQQLSQLNQDGYNPLHLAAANGHAEMVKYLLEYGKQFEASEDQLCTTKDRDGRTALHCAVVAGNVDVVDLLFVHCPKAVTLVTDQGESILHLAVKHHHFEALKFLVGKLTGPSTADLLNRGDREGNTLLHLATAKRQLQIVEYLVELPDLDVNKENSRGLKALDMLFICALNSNNDLYVEEAIRLAGGHRSRSETKTETERINTSSRPLRNMVRDWDSLTEIREGLIVMASLILTLTFQVALAPPGGVWQDYSGQSAAPPSGSVNREHEPGTSIFFDKDRKNYVGLMSLNSASFFGALSVIVLMLSEPFFRRLGIFLVIQNSLIFPTLFYLALEFILILSITTANKLPRNGYFILSSMACPLAAVFMSVIVIKVKPLLRRRRAAYIASRNTSP